MCVCVYLAFPCFFCFAGRACPTFVQVFDGDVSLAIENLNKCWTRPASLPLVDDQTEDAAPATPPHHVQHSFKFSIAT